MVVEAGGLEIETHKLVTTRRNLIYPKVGTIVVRNSIVNPPVFTRL